MPFDMQRTQQPQFNQPQQQQQFNQQQQQQFNQPQQHQQHFNQQQQPQQFNQQHNVQQLNQQQQQPHQYLPPRPQLQPQQAAIDPNTANVQPIKSLNPYNSRWTIKGRVTSKGEVRSYQTQKSAGKVMSVDLLDGNGGEIRATMFNDAVDKFDPVFQVNKVFLISKGSLKPANKKFSSIKNEYEIMLDANSVVVPCAENPAEAIPMMHYSFTPINALPEVEAESIVGKWKEKKCCEIFSYLLFVCQRCHRHRLGNGTCDQV